jgi:hypothetical protein
VRGAAERIRAHSSVIVLRIVRVILLSAALYGGDIHSAISYCIPESCSMLRITSLMCYAHAINIGHHITIHS